MINEIKKIKKVELHLHLDGSVSIPTLQIISNKTEEELKKEMIANEKCKNLSEYLTKFDLPISYMQTKENLKIISKELVDNLEKENVIYAEIRFAPMFHTQKGLTYNEIVEAVLEGLNSNKNINEISNIVGYDNSLYFSRLFKKYTGLSPSEYKKSIKTKTKKRKAPQ